MSTATQTSPDTGLLEVTNLTKRFGQFTAVDDFGLKLEKGRITALIGPNGAGKSTVINMLSGTLLPSEGQVKVKGAVATGCKAHEFSRLGLARTFQSPTVFGELTVLETVMLARDTFYRAGPLSIVLRSPRMRKSQMRSEESALPFLGLVGLEGEADRVAASLPVGSQRLLDLARALASEPEILLLDEPAAGLDPTETLRLGEVVQQIAELDVGVLLVEHDMRMVMSISHDITVLDRGRRIAMGTPEEVGADPKVIDAYLGGAGT